ncbi:MAG: hypothetical protein AAF628_09285 [Planctomycetota bacterium]
MRLFTTIALSAALLTLSACETLGGAMPTSLAGIAQAAGTLSTDITGFLGNLDMSNLMGSALEPLSGFVETGKSLMSGLNNLPAEATSGVDLSGFQNALGGIANFDLSKLMSSMGSEQMGMLDQLKSAAMNLGSQASALTGA